MRHFSRHLLPAMALLLLLQWTVGSVACAVAMPRPEPVVAVICHGDGSASTPQPADDQPAHASPAACCGVCTPTPHAVLPDAVALHAEADAFAPIAAGWQPRRGPLLHVADCQRLARAPPAAV
jgi:hypothetical protein